MKTLVCPHCATQVPAHASVCVGCGAEIVHGATRQERSMAGCFFTVVVMLVTMAILGMGPMPDPHDDAALYLVFKFIALALLANLVGRLAVRWLRRSKLRFLRTYQHD
jgi:predicted nucleic acid-binding Zn ribbon protein